MPIKKMALIAMLVAVATVGRLVIHPAPNVQPFTCLILFCTWYLGLEYGIWVGILGILTSNLLLGLSPTTFFQIISYLVIIYLAWLVTFLPNWHLTLPWLIPAVVVAGFLYGFVITALQAPILFVHLTWQAWLTYYLAGLPFDLNHAIGNGIFCGILYQPFTLLLSRLKRQQLI
ncbi:ECF transporter S component [Periweissella cryptocerci]|nr:ECF transporter S component [Periweissella cryptocerci]